MDSTQIIILVGVFLALLAIGAFAWVFLSLPGTRGREVRSMMLSSGRGAEGAGTKSAGLARGGIDVEEMDAEVARIKKLSGASSGKSGAESLDIKLFKAGIYSEAPRKAFRSARVILPFVLAPSIYLMMMIALGKPGLALLGGVLGIFIGLVGPGAWLDREIRRREEDIMYYLPLVIEQVSIGVSSALDVGPCIAQIVNMADERDSHNPVTEMLVHVEKLIRSGLNLEDALTEVGEVCGMNEVKHAFMFLAQCARHGGEVSRQLQELADAVMVQRQVQVEGRITALPVKATGPLATVFAGFFVLILAGLVIRLLSAFATG